MPDIQYNITLPDGTTTTFSEQQYAENKDKLFSKYADAQVTRTQAYAPDDNDIHDTDTFEIDLGDGKYTVFSASQFQQYRDKILEKYPNGVSKVMDMSARYWDQRHREEKVADDASKPIGQFNDEADPKLKSGTTRMPQKTWLQERREARERKAAEKKAQAQSQAASAQMQAQAQTPTEQKPEQERKITNVANPKPLPDFLAYPYLAEPYGAQRAEMPKAPQEPANYVEKRAEAENQKPAWAPAKKQKPESPKPEDEEVAKPEDYDLTDPTLYKWTMPDGTTKIATKGEMFNERTAQIVGEFNDAMRDMDFDPDPQKAREQKRGYYKEQLERAGVIYTEKDIDALLAASEAVNQPEEEKKSWWSLKGFWQSAKQATARLGGEILGLVSEEGRILGENLAGPFTKDSALAQSALEEFDRRVAAGEDPLRDYGKEIAKLTKNYHRLSKEAQREVDRKVDVYTKIATYAKEGRTADEVRAALEKEAGTQTEVEKLNDIAQSIIATNSDEVNTLGGVLGGLVPMFGTTAMGIGLTAATKNPKYAQAAGNAMFGIFSASSAGGAMLQAKEAGASNEQEQLAGLASAAIMYGIGKIPFNRINMKLAGTASTQATKGLEEAIANPATKNSIEIELKNLFDKASNELGFKLNSKYYIKEYLEHIASHTASFGAMGGLEAVVPLIYQSPDEYPILSNVLRGALEGARDGFFLGTIMGIPATYGEYKNNVNRWKSQGFMAAAEVELKGKVDVEGPSGGMATIEMDEAKPRIVEVTNWIVTPDGMPRFEVILDGKRAWLDVSQIRSVVGRDLTGSKKYKEYKEGDNNNDVVDADYNVDEDAYEVVMAEAEQRGRNASTPEEASAIKQQTLYIEEKTRREGEANGGKISEESQFDLDRAKAQQKGRRDSIRSMVEERIGQQLPEDGRVIRLEDGTNAFVVGETDTDFAYVDEAGNKGTIEKGKVQESKTMGEYLDGLLEGEDGLAEQTRMQNEQKANQDAVMARAKEVGAIDLGTPENPQVAPIVSMDNTGVVLQTAEGNVPKTWREVADYFKMPYVAKTDAEIAQKRLDDEDKAQKYNSSIKPGTDIQVMLDMGEGEKPVPFKFQEAVINEDGDLVIKATPAEGGDAVDILPDMIPDLDSVAAKPQEQEIAAENEQGEKTTSTLPVQPEPDEDGVLRDIDGEPIPLIDAGPRAGQVNENVFWTNKPEAWAAWNDAKHQDGGANTKKYVSNAVAKLQKDINNLRAEYEGTSDFDLRNDIEDRIAQMQNRLDRLNTILEGRYSPLDKAMAELESAAAELTEEELKIASNADALEFEIASNPERAEALLRFAKAQEAVRQLQNPGEEKTTAGAVPEVQRDFRGRAIPMRGEGENRSVDQARFFDKDPEAWAMWDAEQRGDSGENARQYLDAQIGSIDSQLKKMNSQMAKETDFNVRIPLERSIKDLAQKRDELARVKSQLETPEETSRRVTEAKDAFAQEPRTLEEVVAQQLGFAQGQLDLEDFRRQTGYGDEEAKGFNSLWHTEKRIGVNGKETNVKKGGMSIAKFAEMLQAQDETGLVPKDDTSAVVDAILDVFQGSKNTKGLRDYIKNARAAEKAEQERQIADREAFEKEEIDRAEFGEVRPSITPASHPNRKELESKINTLTRASWRTRDAEKKTALIEQKREILKDFYKEIGTEQPIVATRADIIELVEKAGASESTVRQIRDALMEKGVNIEGFNLNGDIFIIADDIESSERARLAYIHERQHGITESEGLVKQLIDTTAASREDLADVMRKMTGISAYDKCTREDLAEEIISKSMEVAYSSTPENLEENLRKAGLDNEEIINFVKNIDDEQRRKGEHLNKARKGWGSDASDVVRAQREGTEDGRDSRQVSGGLLGQEGTRSPEAGRGRAGSPELRGEPGESAHTVAEEIQGLPGYTADDIRALVEQHIRETLSEELGREFSPVDVRVIGSRTAGNARANSDLDILVQYDGEMREDDAFNALNENPLTIEGIKVDINPINTAKSGTADQWIESHKDYQKETPSQPIVASQTDVAQTKDSGINFSITTEADVEQKIRDYAASEEGRQHGWTEEKISSIIEETADLMRAIHAAVSGDKYYDEWAAKHPTTKVDWRDGKEKPIVTWVRSNIEYKYDMSADLLCINNEGLETILASPTMTELMLKIEESSNDGFTSDDYLRLYNVLDDLGFDVPCKGCFDASMRFKMLPPVAKKFTALVNKLIDERNKDPKTFDAEVKARAGENATIGGLPTTAKNKEDAIAIGIIGDGLTEHIDWTQLMSAEGQTKALTDWGGIFRAWQRTGAGRPKDKLLPEPWTGDIVSTTTTIIGKYGDKTPSFRDIFVNKGTGLRRNSHSEFRPILAIDEIQFMREAFIRGLTVFKYMKELDDVRLFGQLGVKFNMSFFPAFVEGAPAAGLDVNGDYIAAEESVGGREFPYMGKDGKLHYDGMKGWKEAQKYVNKDVSLSSVVFSVPHLIKSLTDVPTKSDPRGLWGSLIPLHATGATSHQLEVQGLGKARALGHGFEEAMSDYDKGVTNFEAVQNDRFGEGWTIVEGKKAGTKVEPGHKLEFANGTHYYNEALGLHLYQSFYVYDSELKPQCFDKKGNIIASKAKSVGHPFSIDYNEKVRELGTDTAYQDAADFYITELRKMGLIPRFDFEVPENIFVKMCQEVKVDPFHPKLGWKGYGNSWSPVDSEAYYSLFCDYGMIDPATGKLAPHNPVGKINEAGERVFEMPENTVDIIKAGVKRYSERRDRENTMVDAAIEEYAKRSVVDGKLSQADADAILAAAKQDAVDERIAEAMPQYETARNLSGANASQKQPISEATSEEAVDMSDVDEDVLHLSMTKNNRATVENWLNKREDLTGDQKNEVVNYIDNLEDSRTQLATARWFANGKIRLPEDMDKVHQAISVAGKAKVDPLQYDSPMALLDAHANFKPSEKRINPDEVSTLHRAAEYPDQGIVVYDVDNTEASRQNMRQIINTHFGKDASPWCLLQGDGEGNLTADSKQYWRHYNAYPKQVAFKDGKLLAFSANDNATRLWWDRQDISHYGIPMTMKVEGDELGRSTTFAIIDGTLVREPGSHMYRGNRQNGTYEEWNSSGNVLLERREYKDGREDGLQEIYYPNTGSIRHRYTTRDGLYVGKNEGWFDNGQMQFSQEYNEEGLRIGVVTQWWKNGNKQRETNYDGDGYLHGNDTHWRADGTIDYVTRNEHGKQLGYDEYHDDGSLATRVDYIDDGGREITRFYSDGNISQRETVSYDGETETIHREMFFRNGVRYSSVDFRDGKLNGISEFRDEDGRLTDKMEYKDGEKVRDLPLDEAPTTSDNEVSIKEALAKDNIVIDDEALLKEYGLKNLTLSKKGDVVKLDKIVAERKGEGNGTRFMTDLTSEADNNGWTLALTPDDSFGATSVSRLKKFYKGFGFKDNKGRSADLSISESMIRKPQAPEISPEQAESTVKFSIVKDPLLVAQLEASEKQEGFREMVLNEDGTYSPAIAGAIKQKGKGGASVKSPRVQVNRWEQADEHPELVGEDGKIALEKTDNGKQSLTGLGSLNYNPYNHLRLNLVNTQFKDAWRRKDLVFVRCAVPKSEVPDFREVQDYERSPYRAEKAALPVGIHNWNGGPVMLSRYSKVVGQVPWEEVADDWANDPVIKEKGINFDKVNVQLRQLLVDRGVKINEPTPGMGKECQDAYRLWKEKPEAQLSDKEDSKLANKDLSLQNDTELRGAEKETAESIRRPLLHGSWNGVGRGAGKNAGQGGDIQLWRREYGISEPSSSTPGHISFENLERLFNDLNSDKELLPLFEKVARIAKDTGEITPIFSVPKDAKHGGEAKFSGKVYYNQAMLTNPKLREQAPRIITHELIHSVTSSTLRQYLDGNMLSPSQEAAAREICEIYQKLTDGIDVNSLPENVRYYLQNEYEMVAGVGDPVFRDYLRKIKEGGRTLLRRLIDAIKRILGIDKSSGTMDARLSKAADDLINNFDITTFKGTRKLDSTQDFQSPFFQDKPYLEAVERGDMETAQKMVDEAAERAFANSKARGEDGKLIKLYHGSAETFTRFETTGLEGDLGQGSYFTDDRSLAESYTKPNGDNYWRIDAAIEKYYEEHRGKDNIDDFEEAEKWAKEHAFANAKLYPVYLNIERPRYTKLEDFKADRGAYTLKGYNSDYQEGYDGIIDKTFHDRYPNFVPEGANQFVVFHPNQIKSAEPVTYDDNGNVVPLSERFNLKDDDIRFSITGKYDPKETEELFEAAEERFGTTDDLREAGYILPDGTMLDFSGRHQVSGDSSYLSGDRHVDHRDIADLNYETDLNTPSGRNTDMPDFIRRGAIRVDAPAGMINLAVAPTEEQIAKLRRIVAAKNGTVWVDFGDGWDNDHSAEYEGARTERVLNDIERYFTEGYKPSGYLHFSITNKRQEYFVSNAERAVEDIKSEKATPEQWLKMLEKNGGLKAGEDKWIGLSDWLKEQDKKTLTKEEVLDYINQNKIQIEEVKYTEDGDEVGKELEERYPGFNEAFFIEQDGFRGNVYIDGVNDYESAIDLYNRAHEDKIARDHTITEEEEHRLMVYGQDILDKGSKEFRPIQAARLRYTTEGLDNKREIALIVPTVEPYNKSDEIHFGDAGEGRAIAWVRFGDTTTKRVYPRRVMDELEKKYGHPRAYDKMTDEDVAKAFFADYIYRGSQGNYQEYKDMFMAGDLGADRAEKVYPIFKQMVKDAEAPGQRVLVIDEIQSKRHQDAREKGYRTEEQGKVLTEHAAAVRRLDRYTQDLADYYMLDLRTSPLRMLNELDDMIKQSDKAFATPEMLEAAKEQRKQLAKLIDEKSALTEARIAVANKIPAAPFEKNWHELAFKRMLRYAAENGYDAVAWTTGEQQAERYDLGNVVTSLTRVDEEHFNFKFPSGVSILIECDGNGVITHVDDNSLMFTSLEGKTLSEFVGKELAVKMMAMDEGAELADKDLRIGAEGMKGFYDQILPRFVNKYGKQWGVSVSDIELPIGEAGSSVMHSIPVTDQMRNSVMRDQLMFSKTKSSDEDITPKVRYEMEEIKRAAEKEGRFMKAPNGEDTKLSETNWLMARTKNFKNWFGDWEAHPEDASAVVDENGEPRIVYHGTKWRPLAEKPGKAVFDTDRVGDNFDFVDIDWNFFFTASEASAKGYGEAVPVFLNIRRPEVHTIRERIAYEMDEETGHDIVVNAHDAGSEYDDITEVKNPDGVIYTIRAVDTRESERKFYEAIRSWEDEHKAEIEKEYGDLEKQRDEVVGKIEAERRILYDKIGAKDIFKTGYDEMKDIAGYTLDEMIDEAAKVRGISVEKINELEKAFNDIDQKMFKIFRRIDIEGRPEYEQYAGDEVIRDYKKTDMFAVDSPNQIKSASANNGEFSRQNDDIRFSMTGKDREYIEAVNSGDLAAAQEMVADAVAKAMPDTKVVDKKGNPLVVYKRQHEQHNVMDTAGWGSFFSSKPISDESFGEEVGRFYLNFKRPLTIDAQGNIWSRPLWLELTDKNGDLIPRGEVDKVDGLYGMPKELWYHIYDDETEYEFDQLGQLVRNHNLPYDGVIINNISEGTGGTDDVTDYIALSPEQIKSAEPVTYDDNGEIIPLSKRFDQEKDDIRFSITNKYDGDWSEGDYIYTGPAAKSDGERAALDYIMMNLNQRDLYSSKVSPQDAIGYAVNYAVDEPDSTPWTEKDVEGFKPEMFMSKEDVANEELLHSDAFKKWFGDWEKSRRTASKVVDKKGRPLPVYHGTRQGRFFAFNDSNKGYFFTDDYGVADDYAYYDNDYGYDDEDAMIHEVYLNIRKPFVIDADYYDWKSLPSSYKGHDSGSNTTDGWARYLKGLKGKYDGLIVKNVSDGYGHDAITNIYVAFNKDQIKSAAPVTYDDSGREIPISERFGKADDIRFSITNKRQEIFVSNAERAVEDIKSEKATPEQWLKMLEKNGGLKAGEDKWIGLSDWLKEQDKKTLTKEEVLDYINQNKIQIEETHYSENGVMTDEEFEDLLDELPPQLDDFHTKLQHEFDDLLEEMDAEDAYEAMAEKYGEKFREAYDKEGVVDGESLDWNYIEPLMELAGFASGGEKSDDKAINSTRLTYTSKGLANKREIALTVPSVEPYKAEDNVHFGDAGEGRAIAWIRFGETTAPAENETSAETKYENAETALNAFEDRMESKYGQDWNKKYTAEEKAEVERLLNAFNGAWDGWAEGEDYGKKVLVIDEIQSKRHQDAREKGYETPEAKKQLMDEYLKAKEEYDDFAKRMAEKYAEHKRGNPYWWTLWLNAEEKAEKRQLFADMESARQKTVHSKLVPAAPFEKNWHELAFKRMLRYAAENGYDAVAWTTGEQQAERYDIGGIVPDILVEVKPDSESFYRDMRFEANGNGCRVAANKDGIITLAEGIGSDAVGKTLGEVFGKEVAVKIMSAKNFDTIRLNNLRVGGEGMKGFYDEILPRFANKYGKQWGVKVEDIELPNLEGLAKTMHSIPVTDQMKADVMDGQVMFSKTRRHMRESVDKGGLEAVMPTEDISEFYRDVYEAIPEGIRKEVVDRAMENGLNFHQGLKDYIAELAAKKEDTTGLVRMAGNMIRPLIEGGDSLTDNDIHYILWRGNTEVSEDMPLTIAQNEAMKRRFTDEQPKFSLTAGVQEAGEEAKAKVEEAGVSLDEQKKALKGDLLTAARAMSAQKQYDQNTVDAIVTMAKDLLKDQQIPLMTRREVARVLGIVKASVGRGSAVVKKNVEGLVDLVIDHLMATEKAALDKLRHIKATRTDSTGVNVQGKLDVRGQNILGAFNAGIESYKFVEDDEGTDNSTIGGRMAELSDTMASKDVTKAKAAEAEYFGLALAEEYHKNIKNSIAEEISLKNEEKEAEDEFREHGIGREALNEFKKSIKDSIRENHVARVEAYRELQIKLQSLLEGSADAAAAFRQAERDRINDIHHLANSDLEGRPARAFKKNDEDRVSRLVNDDLFQIVASPLATFDQMLRMLGRKNVNGEGSLWNRFMRGWVDASEKEYIGLRDAKKELDDKVSEVFGRKMLWSDLYDIEGRMPKKIVSWWDDGQMRDFELTQGNLLYIYMVNKMADGKTKLRKMGISEENVAAIKDIIDPRFIKLADWLQDEFLVNLRNKYNAVHERMFGASMAAIEDYFPLRINKNSRYIKEDVNAPVDMDTITTKTGAIKKRIRNSKPLDLLGADAFSTVIEHIDEMESWAAFAEFRRDISTLLSHTRFRNGVKNMNTVYGAGDNLWTNFKDVCYMASGTYRPKGKTVGSDRNVTSLIKGVTAAKITFRIYTAFKQLLSAPAFIADANPVHLTENFLMPWKAWKWSMENLPLLEKRWKSRMAGDTRLMDFESEWEAFKTKTYKAVSKWGMTPNGFIDALTCSIGARSMYQTRYDRYIKDGYTKEQADKKAKQDATVLYNETQQSNESAFVSTMQIDRTFASSALSVFRNASMGYQRQLHDALRTYERLCTPGYKEETIEFMTKQKMREGMGEEEAKRSAERDYNREWWRGGIRVATFGFILQYLWALGGNGILYLLFGKDDKKKNQILLDTVKRAKASAVEGLAGGNIISDYIYYLRYDKSGLRNYNPSLMPIVSDFRKLSRLVATDQVAAASEIINLAVQIGIGVNPQTMADTVVAIIDACNGDLDTAKEAMILIMRVLQCPQSQIDEIYIDELGVYASSAKKMTYQEMAERYAKYKVNRGAPYTNWAYTEEKRKKKEKSYKETSPSSFKAKVKARKEIDAQ